jgi:hypothetical protein
MDQEQAQEDTGTEQGQEQLAIANRNSPMANGLQHLV